MLFLDVAGMDGTVGVLEVAVPKLRIDAAGRIALSPDLLAHLGVGPGQELEVEKTGSANLSFRRAREAHSIAEAFGSLQSNIGQPISIDEINEAIAKGWAGKQ